MFCKVLTFGGQTEGQTDIQSNTQTDRPEYQSTWAELNNSETVRLAHKCIVASQQKHVWKCDYCINPFMHGLSDQRLKGPP